MNSEPVTALQLERIRPSDLPAPPREALQVVQACSDPAIDNPQLAELIERLPKLSAELLRLSNSSFFALRSQVKSIAHAVSLLGHRNLRNLSLCLAMRDAVREDAIPGLDLAAFWEDALRRGVAARLLAAEVGLDGDEAFTVGLLQDFGLLIGFYLRPDRSHEWACLRPLDPDARLQAERTLFGMTHAQIGQELARQWALPDDLAEVIGLHHAPVMTDLEPHVQSLCRLAQSADWLAAVYTADDSRGVIRRCRELLLAGWGLDTAATDALLERINQVMAEAAQAMNLPIEHQTGLGEIMRAANLRLAEDNLSFQEMTLELERALDERNRFAVELERELTLAREVQCSLMPRREVPRGQVIGVNHSARRLSGDFYDYFPTRNEQVYFAIADVSGKGMNAALLMAKASSLFHCLGKVVLDPSVLLATLNREIAESTIRGMFVTMIIGIYDVHSGQGKLANAGHLPALQAGPDGALREFPAQAPPLGVLPEGRFPAVEFDLTAGELYLFTDGLIEAEVQGAPLELEGLAALIRRERHLELEQRLHRIMGAVIPASGSPRDDLTLLAVDLTTSE
ncbi:HDOD domain-containing protein [Thiohalobacter thiocyanaticus]|uniref:HDOD domain-containing protein n=1 Tax=Thiohalobacter thiocyanaticus TaxID=585455 RepID=A0A426QGV0_9GAMM|nr:HDOD domain-containing protein [Thiohalobacter thiocyanaticus]RRQ20963.1 HDOD domain-containing protein [Thiohalobacter thiocyanaticus]